MKPSLALAFALSPLAAQDQPAAGKDLPGFRAAFAANAKGPVIAIACVPGSEPVILTSGSDMGGKELSPQSLLPLLALGKVLAADAIAAQYKDKVDKGSGEKFGDRELTVRELLDGTTLLPDYFVLDGSDGSADAALLRACGAMAVGAKLQLRASALGAAEFVLLEPLAFGGRYKDWQSMLRSTFAPRVPGMDPLSADTLPATAHERLPITAEDMSKLAAARPALLRTILSVKDLATWWQWRSQQDGALWTSARMGRQSGTITNPKEQRWTFSAMALGLNLLASQYPKQKAGLVWLGPSGPGATSPTPVIRAFETDLFGSGEAAPVAAVGGAFGVAGPAAPRPGALAPAADPLAGTRWRTAAAAEGAEFKLAFGEGAKDPLVLTRGPDSSTLSVPTKAGDGYTASGRTVENGQRTLWLWPQPDAAKPAKLSVVMVTMRMSGMAMASNASFGSAVPQYVELVPEPK